MNLSNLKNLVYRREIFDGVVTSKRYEPPKRFGVGLGTLAPPNLYITVEDEKGRKYELATNSLGSFDTGELNGGGRVAVKSSRILGVYFRKADRSKNDMNK